MSSVAATVENSNNVTLEVTHSNNVTLEVTPRAAVQLTIDRSATGPAGPNAIGGYGFSINNLTSQDTLIFNGSAWANTAKTSITDGGNF